MKVIFLDFDGVLNSNKYFINSTENQPFFLEDEKMELLKNIINETNAKIVLSTSWREIWGIDLEISKKLKEYFDSYNIDIFDVTPCINYNRVDEINFWIKQHKIRSFVILDDITGPWYNLESNVIVTNIDFQGLTEEHVKKAINILNK